MGDSVLQLIVCEGLLSRYSAESIGDLALLRSAMVGRASCYKYAKKLNLQKWLIVGNAIDSAYEEDPSARPYPANILSELYEAVLGAIYVDAGLEEADKWFAEVFDWPVRFQSAAKRVIPSYHAAGNFHYRPKKGITDN